jgi:HK97 family phage prohead protease
MSRHICGYASLFETPDLAGDEIARGAFLQSLKSPDIRRVKMLYQHDQSRPIGSWHQIKETPQGLWVAGELAPHVQLADEVCALIKHGAIDGLSIGFRALKAKGLRGRARRRLQQVELVEISIVTFPMQPLARLRMAEIVSPQARRRAVHAVS